jgi:hypothetical protein
VDDLGTVPSSIVAAVACSAAAGKNPWVPLALIFLLAAPDSVPSLMMDPGLHRQLHTLAPVGVLWGLGALFAALTIAESLADKIAFIETWLVPISTAWRPFAGVAVAALVGTAAAREVTAEEALAFEAAAVHVVRADLGLLVGGSVVALSIALSVAGTWIATMSKTGLRLLMSLVPIPGLKLAHSFLDDFFALAASIAGLAFGHSVLVGAMVASYLAVGAFTAPFLTRLTWIHVRIGLRLVRKLFAAETEEQTVEAPPGWARRWLEREGLTRAETLPAYVYRAPGLGWSRAGHLVLAEGRALFLTRVFFRPRAFSIADAQLARLALAETATTRVVTLVDKLDGGALRETHVYLFPARESAILESLRRGAEGAGLRPVRADSESARRGLPGFADRGRSVRFLLPEAAGSLRMQGLVTIAAALVAGLLTGGVFVPIGAGYLLSPLKGRFALGVLVSGYLSLCIVASAGLGWPGAVLYAGLLNVVALRDLTRHALKARIEGFVDRRAWLPLVAGRVWVPASAMIEPHDAPSSHGPALLTDGTWRAVVRLLASESGPVGGSPASARAA